MKTPEQIAEQTVESFEPDDRMTVNGDTYSLGYPLLKDVLVSAIEDYRQHLSLSDARDILDRHGARGVIWSREDVDGELEQRIESGEIPAPSDHGRDRIVDDAMNTRWWDALNDVTDQGWNTIGYALDDAITASSEGAA